MKKNVAKLATFLFVLSCIFMTGCSASGSKPVLAMYDKSSKNRLQVPADFTIKIIGETVYTYGETTIPVAEIIKESLEKNIQKNQNFSLNKGTGNQYLVGIDVIKYEPRIDPEKKQLQLFQYPQLWYEVLVCDIKTDEKGEKTIGDVLLVIPQTKAGKSGSGGISLSGISVVDLVHDAVTNRTAWRDVLEDTGENISEVLNKAFQK